MTIGQDSPEISLPNGPAQSMKEVESSGGLKLVAAARELRRIEADWGRDVKDWLKIAGVTATALMVTSVLSFIHPQLLALPVPLGQPILGVSIISAAALLQAHEGKVAARKAGDEVFRKALEEEIFPSGSQELTD